VERVRMTLSLYEEISQKLWRGYDPYYGFPHKTVKPDLQGWASQHRYLTDTITARRPRVVVEVGVWKGASVLELARSIRTNGLDAVVIAVDTWLGAWDHWTNDHLQGELGFEFGYPTIYRTFLTNMILGEVKDIVIPLPLDSGNAQHTLESFGIFPDVVHIDGAHDFDTVLSDLTHWWSVLTTGGTIIMDDYFDLTPMWPDVLKAVRTFLERVDYTEFEAEEPKCRFVKCAGAELTLGALDRFGALPAGEPPMGAKRAIRLKEFPRSIEITKTPPDWYVAACDSSLVEQPFKIVTDENGFILPQPLSRPGWPTVIFLGDSVIEGMFAPPQTRLCSRLQDILGNEEGVHVAVLNAGYGGATVLHSFNTFMNKIIPLHPAAVVLMTGMVDVDVALLKASFWSRDCWIEPIIDLDETNQWRDPDLQSEPSYDNQSRLIMMFAMASRTFEVPLWFATTPHRQVFEGEYVAKAFKSRADFNRDVSRRQAVNAVMRQVAKKEGVLLFDLEADLEHRSDIFYDKFHLNVIGGEVVARSLIKSGFVEGLRLVGVACDEETPPSRGKSAATMPP
jgi:predicted O-methyltransferase YrrM